MMSEKKQILFVDDEPMLLRGVRRQLVDMQECWKMVFVQSGEEALKTLSQASTPFDVLVTDIRMPGLDGVQLLKKVQEQFPPMIRIVLSGQVDQKAALRTAGLAHQFLSKPCQTLELKSVLSQALRQRKLLRSKSLRELTSQLKTLPSQPALYDELVAEIESPKASIKQVGYIISQDVAMTAKILQLVNSAFFGLGRRVSDPGQAVMLLGLDIIKALVLSIHIFGQFSAVKGSPVSLPGLQQHSLAVAALARRIAQVEKLDLQSTNFAFAAGLLHDVGRLVLVTNLLSDYGRAIELKSSQGLSLLEAERQIFGATHTEVGAYLMGLWGLPDPVVETLAFHHQPSSSRNKQLDPLTTVHVANVLVHEGGSGALSTASEFDETYLVEIGCLDKVPQWREIGQALAEKGAGQ
ncbi:MAG TPA: response regulator [Anaerolineae bacterium]|nr:response regulator [Anaerolineae bacterium]